MREKPKSSRKTVTIFQDLNNRIQKNQKIGKLHKYTNSMQWVSSEDTLTERKNTLKTSLPEINKRYKKKYQSEKSYRVLEKNRSNNHD